eukprot:10686349-Prorocentrum_lima.AAC.1
MPALRPQETSCALARRLPLAVASLAAVAGLEAAAAPAPAAGRGAYETPPLAAIARGEEWQ